MQGSRAASWLRLNSLPALHAFTSPPHREQLLRFAGRSCHSPQGIGYAPNASIERCCQRGVSGQPWQSCKDAAQCTAEGVCAPGITLRLQQLKQAATVWRCGIDLQHMWDGCSV